MEKSKLPCCVFRSPWNHTVHQEKRVSKTNLLLCHYFFKTPWILWEEC